MNAYLREREVQRKSEELYYRFLIKKDSHKTEKKRDRGGEGEEDRKRERERGREKERARERECERNQETVDRDNTKTQTATSTDLWREQWPYCSPMTPFCLSCERTGTKQGI